MSLSFVLNINNLFIAVNRSFVLWFLSKLLALFVNTYKPRYIKYIKHISWILSHISLTNIQLLKSGNEIQQMILQAINRDYAYDTL